MVRYETVVLYECPFCLNEYNTLEKASGCRDKCLQEPFRQIRQKEIDSDVCEMCGKSSLDICEGVAMSCEYEHRQANDRYYQEYIKREYQKINKK